MPGVQYAKESRKTDFLYNLAIRNFDQHFYGVFVLDTQDGQGPQG